MPFTIKETSLKGVFGITPRIFNDNRGHFLELFSKIQFEEFGIKTNWVQDNLSVSHENVLRGMHFQTPPFCQEKLVTCLAGEVLDVMVDLRADSPTYMKWEGIILKGDSPKLIYIPEGFAHGFCVLKGPATLYYKCSKDYSSLNDGGIHFSDPDISIEWPEREWIISDKDKTLPLLKNINNPFTGV